MTDVSTPEIERRSVAFNASSLFMGRLISALSIWGALIVLAKLAGAETVGIYALAQAICIPISEVLKIGLREIRSSDVEEDYDSSDYFRLRLVFGGIAMAAMVAVSYSQADTGAILTVLGIYAVVRVVEMITDILHARFLLVERLDYVGISLCISGPLALLALALGYYLTGDLIIAVTGQLVAVLAVLLFYDLPLSRKVARARAEEAPARNWNVPKLTRLAWLAMPMGFGAALIMVGLYVPRLWVGAELGVAALGIFGPILAMAMAPDRLINSMLLAISVRLARHHVAGERGTVFLRLAQLVGGLVFLGLPAIYVCHRFGGDILAFIYNDSFAEYGPLLVLVAVAGFLRVIANTLGFGLIAAQQFWWFTWQNGIVAVVAVLACHFLIGEYGLVGAGWSMVLIFSTQLVLALIGLTTVKESRGAEAP